MQAREQRVGGRGGDYRGPHKQGFDFTGHMRSLCFDIAHRLPAFRHIDMRRVAISFSQARKRVRYGLFATTTPLRFEEGRLTTSRRGRTYTVQRLFDPQGVEMFYIVSFYLPRFMDIAYREKLITVFHELWHISPHFDGDLRRHPGRCYAHSHSQKEYDRQMAQFVDEYFRLGPPEELYGFLRHSFQELQQRHGVVRGTRIPHPKLIPVACSV